jgi:hypothetical protein
MAGTTADSCAIHDRLRHSRQHALVVRGCARMSVYAARLVTLRGLRS